MMIAIKNFLDLVTNNWTTIIVVIGLCIALYEKIKSYMALSKNEKIQLAKDNIDKVILDLMTNAELYFAQYAKAGKIKRSEVIRKIYEMYPILSEYKNQDELIEYIDNKIEYWKPYMEAVVENKVKELLNTSGAVVMVNTNEAPVPTEEELSNEN